MNLKKSFRNILGITIASTIMYFSLDSKMQDSIKDVTLMPIRRLAYRFASQTEAGYHDIDIILDAIVLGDGIMGVLIMIIISVTIMVAPTF